MERWVIMLDSADESIDGDNDTKLFPYLPDDSFLPCLILFTFAAREFPEALPFTISTFCGKESITIVDNCSAHPHGLHSVRILKDAMEGNQNRCITFQSKTGYAWIPQAACLIRQRSPMPVVQRIILACVLNCGEDCFYGITFPLQHFVGDIYCREEYAKGTFKMIEIIDK